MSNSRPRKTQRKQRRQDGRTHLRAAGKAHSRSVFGQSRRARHRHAGRNDGNILRGSPRPLRASLLRKRGDESRGVSYAQNPVSMPQLRGASALRRNPPCVMQTRTSPLVQDMRQPLLRARRGGVAAHGHGLRRTTCPVSRTCHRSGAAPDSNETEIGELSCRAGCGRFFRASQPHTALRCSPSSHRAAILA